MISGRRIAEFPRTWTVGTRTPDFSNALSPRDQVKREGGAAVAHRDFRVFKRFCLTRGETGSETPRSTREPFLEECVVPRIAKLFALAAVIAAMTAPARAQVPEQQGFFGNIDGRWMWLGGDRIVAANAASDI